MIKLVCTDIDGTILKEDFTFSAGVAACMKRLTDEGVKVVLVTGRMHSAAKYIAEDLGLNTPIVSYQGGLIIDGNDVLYERCLAPEFAHEIICWARENSVHLNLYSNDKLYVENDDYIAKRYAGERYTTYEVKPFDEVPLNGIHKLLAIDFENPDRVTKWQKEMAERYPELYIVKSTPYFCEFSNLEASKYCAVKFLQEYWGLRDDEILTIGDQDNDIKLLEAGGTKVAMGNGTYGVKAIADYITDTVDNDGFVKAMEIFVLCGEKLNTAGKMNFD